MAWTTEIRFYLVIWTAAVFYSIYCFGCESRTFFSYFEDIYGDFREGWNFLNRPKDGTDAEWESFLYLFVRISIWLAVQVVSNKVALYLNFTKVVAYTRILISSLFIIIELGTIPFLMIIFQPFVFILAAVPKSFLLIWIIGCANIILATALYKELLKNEEFLESIKISENQAHLLITASGWMNLKCISYYLDYFNEKKNDGGVKSGRISNLGEYTLTGPTKQSNKPFARNHVVLCFLEYCLYLPMLIFGPLILYDEFRTCQGKVQGFSGLTELKTFTYDIAKCLFWILFLEFWLHFIYVNATSFQPQLAMALSPWAFYGYGYAMGQVFHIKYVVIYGFSTSVAKFEGVPVPSLPKCIGRIHLYSDMWKYFDAGLYKFLIRYIYVPTMGAKRISNKIFSSFVCFAFVYVWHGLEYYIFVWSLLNFIGVSIETVSAFFYQKHMKNLSLVSSLSESCVRRLTCLFASPLLMMSAVSNFYFFAGANIGDIFAIRILNGELHTNILLLLILYCCCQVSTELRHNTRTVKKVKKN